MPKMIYPVPHHNDIECLGNYNIQSRLIKDEEKINKLIDLCKELNLEVSCCEDGRGHQNNILIIVPYKRVYFTEKDKGE